MEGVSGVSAQTNFDQGRFVRMDTLSFSFGDTAGPSPFGAIISRGYSVRTLYDPLSSGNVLTK
jgi:hypothetical protein